MLIDIKSMTKEELEELMVSFGEPKFRAAQIFKWLHSGVVDFCDMSNISKNLREKLAEKCYIADVHIEKKLESRLDNTVKYLYSLNDGECVESVLMKYHYGYSVCVSTQVGCRMGCTFCASGIGGFKRNLTASEILSQVMAAERDNNIRVSHIVLMGMGEPLDNYDNVLRFLRLVSSEEGMNISMRHISVSTSGVVPRIYDLKKEKLGITLSVSLHAPNDEIRSRTMPINKKWNTEELLKACREYAKFTRRRVSFEYAVISGVNDSKECALLLAERLKGMLCHVNLIPVNEVKESGYKKPSTDSIRKFCDILNSKGITATVRRILGSDINASCGQLRRSTLENKGI